MRKLMLQGATAAIIAAAALAVTATTASAYVVCNGEGECWHAQEQYKYDPAFGVTIHPDTWKWGDGDHYRWHEHEGRGYWKGGVWVTF